MVDSLASYRSRLRPPGVTQTALEHMEFMRLSMDREIVDILSLLREELSDHHYIARVFFFLL